ncbi:MAG: outer membrane protein assembly factor BamA [Desulfobacterales bacterium]
MYKSLAQSISIIIIFSCFIFFFSPPGFALTADSKDLDPIVADIIIRIAETEKDPKILSEIAENLIYLKKSEPFSSEILQDSIQALKLSRKFAHIDIDSEDTAEGIMISFFLTPFRFIKGTKFFGAYPIFEQRLLSAITIYTGDAFVPDEIEKQASLIEKVFIDEGFINPKVDIIARIDPEDGNVILTFDIQKGEYLRLNQLKFAGNQHISSGWLKLKMKTWKSGLLPGNRGRFIEKDLMEDIEKLVTFYRKKQYADVRITHKIEKDFEERHANVVITIEEGPLYHVEFQGNEHFWDLTLKKDLVIFEEGNLQDMGLRKSLRRIKERYREAGFLETQINLKQCDEQKQKDAVRKVEIAITEGPRFIVETVDIVGNQHIEDKKIQKQILTRPPGIIHAGNYLPETLELDTMAIKTLYAQEGYTETVVTSDTDVSDQKQITVSLDIEEGQQTIVDHIKFKGLTVLNENEAYDVITLKPGVPFRKYMVKSDENTLSGLISAYGYPHVTVSGTVSFSQDRSKADVVFEADEGTFVKMGDIYYSGNFRTKGSILAREVDMEPGDPFSLRQMLEGQRAIRNMDIFDSVKFKTIGLKEKAEDVHLFVEMEERKPYYIQTGFGYQTDLGAYINLKAGDRNFLGQNKDIWLGGSFSEIGYRAEFWYSDPWFFGTKIPNSFGIFTEKKEEFNKNFGVKIHGASLGFSRIWTSHFSTGLAFRYENRKKYDTNGFTTIDREQADDEDQFRSRNIIVITPSAVYDTRDSSIRPRKGLMAAASADFSQGINNDLDSFIKYNLDGRYFFTPEIFPWLTMACLARMGYIEALGDVEDIPEDQLFFLGGTTDVRGFKENMLLFDAGKDPVGGRLSMVGSLEARIDLGGNFELTTFLDAGQLTDTEISVDETDTRLSAGLGLRYITPIGPVGLLYGHKLDRKEGESPGRIHFSIGYTF